MKLTLEKNFYHARFRDPNLFTIVRTPTWASHAANVMAADEFGYNGNDILVRVGQLPVGSWAIQAILLPAKNFDETMAREIAQHIFNHLDKKRYVESI